MFAAAEGFRAPSKAAELVAEMIAPPGAGEVVAQGVQAALNVGVTVSQEMMAATIRQHGISPAAALQDIKIQLAIKEKPPQ